MSAPETPPGGAAPLATPPAPALQIEAVTFRWDLDKTYLRTEFESLRKMVRIPFEAGADKVHLPGVPQLIQGLRRCASERGERPFVFFLSASPPQIGAAIREKLALDGIEYDGLTFKDQLRNLVRGHWRSLREQVGYKLGELLRARAAGPAATREVLFGDDWESDPLIYTLYADVLAGTLDDDILARILEAVGVQRRDVEGIQTAARLVHGTAPGGVARIYINLERRTPPSQFQMFGARIVPTFNYLQAAASLFEAGALDSAALVEVARAIVLGAGDSSHRLRNSIDDLTRRGHLRLATRDRIVRMLAKHDLTSLARDEAALRSRLRAALERFRRRRRDRRPLAGPDYERVLASVGGKPREAEKTSSDEAAPPG
ncbi:MAG: hypothetical protein FJ144_09520 [Deltaproteobacteria bacterium]|nr:hypothetical protein [Deltaproteobacteria bacterium]